MSNRFANTVSSLSLFVALGSGFYTAMTNWRNQENIVLSLNRDYYAGLSDAQPAMTVKDREAMNGLKARYTAVISNTSNSASVSILNISLTVTQFTGWGIIQIPSPYPQPDGRDLIKNANDHQIVKFPIRLAAGETISIEFYPVITVDVRYGNQVKGGLPHHEDGGFSDFGFEGHDMFGNVGNAAFPNNFESMDIAAFHQPHVELRADSGRGYTYKGLANWYPEVFKTRASK